MRIHPACELCKGACCLHFRLPHTAFVGNIAEREWLKIRATAVDNQYMTFDFPCPKLVNGQCSIYNHRPWICRNFPVGGQSCEAAIRRVHPERLASEILSLTTLPV